PAHQRAAIEQPYDLAAMMMIFIVFIVGVFYCLDALYGERRDRSILFWKSLPASDLTTVLSKATIPLVVLPLIAFVITVCVQVIMVLETSANLLLHGMSPATTWAHVPLFQNWLVLLYGLVALALWHAPIRLAAAGFRLGAARDISLGRVANYRDPNLRENYVRHFAFRLPCEPPSLRIRAARFWF